MTPALHDLLFRMRQDPAFPELLQGVSKPEFQEFSSTKGDAAAQYAAYTFRSGARRQHEAWRQFLIGDPTSDKEKS